jgi:hypothetical protein
MPTVELSARAAAIHVRRVTLSFKSNQASAAAKKGCAATRKLMFVMVVKWSA